MRKITSKKHHAKKAKRNRLIGGLILISIMILSIIGYSLNSSTKDEEETLVYNGLQFEKENGLWNVEIGDLDFSFTTSPEETEYFEEEFNLVNSYLDKPLYVQSESEDSIIELYRNLYYNTQIVQRVQEACYDECEDNLPVKTCEDNFIIINIGEESKIEQVDNCVFIEGKEEDLIKLTDSFLLKIIGINSQ